MVNEELVSYALNEIRRYLSRSPAATDTLDGINLWWIQWRGVSPDPKATQLALERLEESGELERVAVRRDTLWRVKRRD